MKSTKKYAIACLFLVSILLTKVTSTTDKPKWLTKNILNDKTTATNPKNKKIIAKIGKDKQGKNIIKIFENKKQIKTLRGNTEDINCLAFGPNDIYLVSGSDYIVRVWDWKNEKLMQTLYIDHYIITDDNITLSTDDKNIKIIEKINKVEITDPNTKKTSYKKYQPITAGYIEAVGFNPKNNSIVACETWDTKVIIWDWKKNKLMQVLEPKD